MFGPPTGLSTIQAAMSQTAYLTVQDHLWINLNVTKKPAEWSFAKLEEATYYQYNYGQSADPIGQAARYAVGFPRKQPFGAGNEATAFVGLVTFLGINGYKFSVAPDAAESWYRDLLLNPNDARSRIQDAFDHDEHAHGLEVEGVGSEVIARYGNVISALVSK